MTTLTTPPYQVLLYYHYSPIDDAPAYVAEHHALCTQLNLLGRILIAGEGINGTVSGTFDQTCQYMQILHADPRFADMQFKIDPANSHAFHKLIVKYRPEIVKLGLEKDVDPLQQTGKRLSPVEFHDALQREDVLIIDARNDYEFQVGHFRNAICPPLKTFNQFPQWIRENLAHAKDRPILTYCTGGIRCEKFSAFLLSEGFKDVSQLDGGIVTYGKDPEVRGHLFDGQCYVFDERVTVPVNHTPDATVVGICHYCHTPTERFVNCANLACKTQYLCCVPCEFTTRRSCTPACQAAENHEFDLATAGTEKAFYR